VVVVFNCVMEIVAVLECVKFKNNFLSITRRDLNFGVHSSRYRRTVLEEVAQYTSLCSEKFREAQNRVEASLQAIRPNQEYKDFTERHKYVLIM